jgi:outer membrane receptor protein involved in Fe transport
MRKLITFAEIFVLLISGIITSFGQTHYIKGTVLYAETNEPIEKIQVSVKGTGQNTTTDEYGEFKLEIPDSITTVSFAEFEGMEIKDIRKSGNNVYKIYLSNTSSELYKLTLEELLKIEVISASNISEKLYEVPATMIVLSEQDILERGYYSLSEMFSDLPGMDISRPYGDQTPVFNYWRGFRTAYSQPYIFMIDGMTCNDIFYNQPQIIDNIPVSNIEKVEIVYGPVSAVYGANAFMGVINVITKKKGKENDIFTDTRTRIDNAGNFIEDLYVRYQNEKFITSLAVRLKIQNFPKN